MVPPRNLARAQDVGTAVHLACQYLDEGDLDLESVDQGILGYVVGYQKFREEYQVVYDLIEHAMIGELDGMKYGMRFDRLGRVNIRGSEETMLLDIKTSSRVSPSWPIQTAAYLTGYAGLFTLEGEPVRPRRAVVHLAKDATYRVLRHTVEADVDVWAAALRLAYWRLANGAKL
jgi:hypothetical protein